MIVLSNICGEDEATLGQKADLRRPLTFTCHTIHRKIASAFECILSKVRSDSVRIATLSNKVKAITRPHIFSVAAILFTFNVIIKFRYIEFMIRLFFVYNKLTQFSPIPLKTGHNHV